MKLHAILTIAILLQLAMLARSQFPQAMPFGPPMGGPPMPMPMPMPMAMMPHQRMPMVMMPYHSKTADNFRKPRRKRPRKIYRDHESDSTSSSDSDSDSESSSSDEVNLRASGASRGSMKRRRQVLTPVVSYVTKDGYVVYQKKIRKDRAKDWLEMGKGKQSDPKEQSAEMTLRQLKRKFSKTKKKRRYHGHHGHD